MRLRILLGTVLTAVLLMFGGVVPVSADQAGCGEEVVGPLFPGTVCDDGSIPQLDSTLPAGCPGSSRSDTLDTDYRVVCPSRPGRSECEYFHENRSCKNVAGLDISRGDANATDQMPLSPHSQRLYDRLADAINLVSGLVGIIVVVSVITGGIQYSLAGGDSQKVQAAKKRIFTAVSALLAFFFVYAFLQYLVPGGVF